MGKIAIWILVAIAVMLVLRLIASNKRRVGADPSEADRKVGSRGSQKKDDAAAGSPAGELMMSCAVCDVHMLSSDAVFARGKVFCSPEHRDLDEARRESGEA